MNKEKYFFTHYPTIEYKTCCLYVRCSKEEQAKFGDTIEAQTEDLKAFAKQHHLKVYEIYVDEGCNCILNKSDAADEN